MQRLSVCIIGHLIPVIPEFLELYQRDSEIHCSVHAIVLQHLDAIQTF